MTSYAPLVKIYFLTALSYRINHIAGVVSGVVSFMVALAIWRALTGDMLEINSGQWIYSYALLASLLYVATSTRIAGDIEREVRRGTVETLLLKPLSVHVAFIAMAAGKVLFFVLLVALPSLVIVIATVDVPFVVMSTQSTLGFVLSGSLSVVTIVLIDVSVGLLSFWLTAIFGVDIIKENLLRLLGGAFIPLAFYPPAMQSVVSALPFQLLFHAPISSALSAWNAETFWPMIGKQVSLAGACYLVLSLISWRIRSRLTVMGG